MDLNECLPTSLPFSLSPVKEIYVQVTFLVLRGYFQVLTTDRATMLLGEKLNFYGYNTYASKTFSDLTREIQT